MPLHEDVFAKLDELFENARADVPLKAQLNLNRQSLLWTLQQLPESLLKDLNEVLKFLIDHKQSAPQLYTEIIELKIKLGKLEAQLSTANERHEDQVRGLNNWIDSLQLQSTELRRQHRIDSDLMRSDLRNVSSMFFDKQQELNQIKNLMAARQIFHALDEKLLRLVASKLRRQDGTCLPLQDFWNEYRLSNIGMVAKKSAMHPELLTAWGEVQADYNIKQSADQLWDDLVFGKGPLNDLVHATGFNKLTYVELVQLAETEFTTGPYARSKVVFLEALELNNTISVKTTSDMYMADI